MRAACERDEAPAHAISVLRGRSFHKSGGDLLSRGVSPQVPSALAVFTSVFGMGTGVSPPLLPPEAWCCFSVFRCQPLIERCRASTNTKEKNPKPSAD
jgi:hypothetical protein